MKIYYYPKSHVSTKEENSLLLQMHKESLSHYRLGEICCDWDGWYIQIEGFVEKKLNQNLIWFLCDNNKEDNISGSRITVDIGYYNSHVKEGQYLKMICEVDDTIASIANNGGFDVDLIKFVD